MNMTEEIKFSSKLTVADMVAVFLCLRQPNARALADSMTVAHGRLICYFGRRNENMIQPLHEVSP